MKVGSFGKGKTEVKYGGRFPVVGERMNITNHLGSFVIEFFWVGTPEWTSKHTVLVPTEFKLIEIRSLSTKGKVKQSGFQLL